MANLPVGFEYGLSEEESMVTFYDTLFDRLDRDAFRAEKFDGGDNVGFMPVSRTAMMPISF